MSDRNENSILESYDVNPEYNPIIDSQATTDLINTRATELAIREQAWASGLNRDLEISPYWTENELGYTLNQEGMEEHLNFRSEYADDEFMNSYVGAGVEGIRQGLRGLGINTIDALGKVIGSDSLVAIAHTARLEDAERLEIYEDDFVKRNIANATRSISQVLGLTAGTVATGGAIGVAGAATGSAALMGLGSFIGSANVGAVSLGFGLNTALDTYDQARFTLGPDKAVRYAITQGIAEGGTEYILGGILGRGMAAMASRPYARMAKTQGIKMAMEAMEKPTVAGAVKEFGKDIIGEQAQEFTNFLIQETDRLWTFDEDLDPEQTMMAAADVFFSTLLATAGMGGYQAGRQYVERRGMESTPRSKQAYDAAQSAFDVVNNRKRTDKDGKEIDGTQVAVDAILDADSAADVLENLKAAQEVLFQFTGQKGRNYWNIEVVPKVQKNIAQRLAVERQIAINEEKNEVGWDYATRGPVALPENAIELYEASKGIPVTVDEEGNPVGAENVSFGEMRLPPKYVAANTAEASEAVEEAGDDLETASKIVRNFKLDIQNTESGKGKSKKGKDTQTAAETAKLSTAELVSNGEAALERLRAVDTEATVTLTPLEESIQALKSLSSNEDTSSGEIRKAKKKLSNATDKALQMIQKQADIRVSDKQELFNRLNISSDITTPGLAENIISENDYRLVKSAADQAKERDRTKVRSLVKATVLKTANAILGTREAFTPEGYDISSGKEMLRPDAEGTTQVGLESVGNVQLYLGWADTIIDKYTDAFLSDFYEDVSVWKRRTVKDQTVREEVKLSVPSVNLDAAPDLTSNLQLSAFHATSELLEGINKEVEGLVEDDTITESSMSTSSVLQALVRKGIKDENVIDSEAKSLKDKMLKAVKKAKEENAKIGKNSKKLPVKPKYGKLSTIPIAILTGTKTSLIDELKVLGESTDKRAYAEYELRMDALNDLFSAIGRAVDTLPLNELNANAFKNGLTQLRLDEEIATEVTEVPSVEVVPETQAPKVEAPIVPKAKPKKTKQKPSKPTKPTAKPKSPSTKSVQLRDATKRMVDEKLMFVEGRIQQLEEELKKSENAGMQEQLQELQAAKNSILELRKAFGKGTMNPTRFKDLFEKIRPTLKPEQTKLSDQYIKAYRQVFESQKGDTNKTPVVRTNNPMWHIQDFGEDVDFVYAPGGIAIGAYYGKNTALGRAVGEHIQIDEGALNTLSEIYKVDPKTMMAATLAHEGTHVSIETIFGDTKTQDEAMATVARDAANIPELADVYKSVKTRYQDGNIQEGRTRDGVIGEEILAKIAQDVAFGTRTLSAPEQSLWNKFKLSLRHWLLKTGYGKALGMKWEGRDLDYFAYKLLEDRGAERVPVYEKFASQELDALLTRANVPMSMYVGPSADFSFFNQSRYITQGYVKAKELAAQEGIVEGQEMPKEKYAAAHRIAAATGWFPGLDGKLQTWVDDSKATLNTEPLNGSSPYRTGTYRLSEIYDHPSLYKLYPELRNLPVELLHNPKILWSGSFSSKNNSIEINTTNAVTYELIHSALKHEIQHWVQDKEGFAAGTDVAGLETFIRAYSRKPVTAVELSAVDEYMQLNGTPTDGADFIRFLENYGIERGRGITLYRSVTQHRPLSKLSAVYRAEVGEIQARASQSSLDRPIGNITEAATRLTSTAAAESVDPWISKMYGNVVRSVSNDTQSTDALISIAQGVLALQSKTNPVSFGDYMDALKGVFGEDLGWLKQTEAGEAIEANLKRIWNAATQVKQVQKSKKSPEKAQARMLREMVKKIRSDAPQVSMDTAKKAVLRAAVPMEGVDLRLLVDSVFEKIAAKEITNKLGVVHQAGITLTKNVTNLIKREYADNWNIADSVLLEKVQAVKDMGKITEDVLKDEIEDISKRIEQEPQNSELRMIENSLQDQLQRLRFGEVQTPQGPRGLLRDRGSRLWTSLLKYSTIQGYMEQLRHPEELITAVKAAGSIRPYVHNKLQALIEPIAVDLVRDKEVKDIVNQHTILYVEGSPEYLQKVFPTLPQKAQDIIKAKAPEIRTFYDFAKSLTDSYGLDLDFQQHKIEELEAKIKELKKRGKNRSRVAELYNQIALVQSTHYVNIHSKFIPKNKPQMSETHTRKTLTLYGLLKEKGLDYSELDTIDILVEYMDSIGRDIAIANIFRAAQRSGLARPIAKSNLLKLPEGWTHGKDLHSTFKSYIVDQDLADIIYKNVLNKDISAGWKPVRTFFNIMKTKEFVNPAIMNVINMFQGTMMGIVPLQGVRQAYKDVMNMSENYALAVKLNTFSRPNTYTGTDFLSRRLHNGNTTTQQILAMLINKEAGKKVAQGEILNGIKTLLGENTILGMYKAAHSGAWLGDEILRMAAFNTLMKRGYTAEEAANHVSRVYVDYADLPVQTRKYATMVFFTPVYAFETIRGMYKNARDAGTVLTKVAKGQATNQDMMLGAKSIVGWAAGNALLTGLMMLGGFEPEDEKWWDKLTLGYKFVKPHTTKEGLKKEVAVKMGGPYIVLQRELNRFLRGFDVDSPIELPGEIFRSYATMQHPIFRNLAALFKAEDRFGEPMYNEHDSFAVKFGKSLKVTALDWVPMLGFAMGGTRGFVTDESRQAALGSWYNVGTAVVTDLFWYPSLRDTKAKRIVADMKRQRSAYLSAVRKHYAEYKSPNDKVLTMLKDNFSARMDELSLDLETATAKP